MSPRASDDLRSAWPDGQDEAIAHLEAHGHRHYHYDLIPPAGIKMPWPGARLSAMQYLVDEWDWGWIK